MKIYKITLADQAEKVVKIAFVKAFNTRDAVFAVNNELRDKSNELLFKDIEEIAIGDFPQVFNWQDI